MKIPLLALALLVCAFSAPAQPAGVNSAPYVGEYFGVALPVGSVCTSERLLVIMNVNADYTLTGSVVNWENAELLAFSADWPVGFSGSRFDSRFNSHLLASHARGTFSAKAGTVTGIVDLRPDGGCRYTFKAYRRFKNN